MSVATQPRMKDKHYTAITPECSSLLERDLGLIHDSVEILPICHSREGGNPV